MPNRPAWLQPHGRPWTRGAERVVYDNPWIKLSEFDAVAPTGVKAAYGVVGFKNLAVAVLPLHDNGDVTLVGQSRFPHGDYSWEIPEGGSPADGDPLEGAKRELAEETGLRAAAWREVMRVQLSNSVTDERAVGYIALDLSPAPGPNHRDPTEELAVARAPFRQVLEAALAGYMPDMLTVAMLLRAYHMAREGALPGALARNMLR